MANEEHLEILKRGVKFWNQWRQEHPTLQPDLSGIDLRPLEFEEVFNDEPGLHALFGQSDSLYEPEFLRAVLDEANLKGANFNWARLNVSFRKADLTGASLYGADLSGSDFSHASLRNSDLRLAILRDVTLENTDISEASLWKTLLAGVDLSQVDGLENVTHTGPSTVSIDTLTFSKGRTPISFLRGCGLSEVQIEMAKLHNPLLTSKQVSDIVYNIHHFLVDGVIHYNSCFISHANQDKLFAENIYSGLQNSGVRCWYAPEDMKIGAKLRLSIDESIHVHDKLLLILSEHSVNSTWVEKEVETAFEKERETGKLVLFPIRIDDSVMETRKGWPADIKRTRNIGDFCKWKDPDAYQKSFDILLRDLRIEER